MRVVIKRFGTGPDQVKRFTVDNIIDSDENSFEVVKNYFDKDADIYKHIFRQFILGYVEYFDERIKIYHGTVEYYYLYTRHHNSKPELCKAYVEIYFPIGENLDYKQYSQEV